MRTHTWELSGVGKAPFQVVGFMSSNKSDAAQEACCLENDLTYEDYHYGSCRVCGIRLVNNYLIDSADGHHFSVGCDCVQSSGDAGLIDDVKKVKRTRRQLQKAAERRARQAQWEREAEEKLVKFYQAFPESTIKILSYNGSNPFINDVAGKLERYGNLSNNQIDVVLAAIDKDKQHIAEIANAEPIPITDKRIQIKGVIIKTAVQMNDFGNRCVATIKDDRGFLVWGTFNHEGEKGEHVEFMARVTPSDKDPKFGFYKRPTKIVLNPKVPH